MHPKVWGQPRYPNHIQTISQQIANIEEQLSNWNAVPDEGETVDKSMVGGFSAKSMEEADSLVQELLKNGAGFKDVEVTSNDYPIVFAHWKNVNMLTHKLWASENRSAAERRRCKIESKIKKFLIEICSIMNCKVLQVSSSSLARKVLNHPQSPWRKGTGGSGGFDGQITWFWARRCGRQFRGVRWSAKTSLVTGDLRNGSKWLVNYYGLLLYWF